MMRIQNMKQTKTCLKDLVGLQEETKHFTLSKQIDQCWLQDNTGKNFIQNNTVYDEFIYTDKLTKKKIRMRDAKTSYERRRHFNNSPNLQFTNMALQQQRKKHESRIVHRNSNQQLQRQITDLNQCFLMLKSTEMFKLNSLREKIFRNPQRAETDITRKAIKCQTSAGKIHGNLQDLLIKKKKIRKILQDSIKQANLQQLRKCFSNPNHKINHKIVQMNRQIPRSFNKSNIQKIIQTITASDKDKDENEDYKFLRKADEDFQFPGEEKLKSDLLGYMRKQMKKNGEYLVVPEKKRLLYQRLYNNTTVKSGGHSSKIAKKSREQTSVLNLDKNSHEQSILTSRIIINIPSEETILQQTNKQTSKQPQKPQGKAIFTKNSLFVNQVNQNKDKRKKQNQCINFTLPQTQNKENTKPSKITSFLQQFSFTPCQKNSEVSKIEVKLENNRKFSTKKFTMKEQRFLFLVENGLLFDVQKEILMNPDYLFLKDNNQDNLLMICAKNHSTQMFSFIAERYKKSEMKKEMTEKWGYHMLKNKLLQKNKNNKNVLQVARVYRAEEIMQILVTLSRQIGIRDYI